MTPFARYVLLTAGPGKRRRGRPRKLWTDEALAARQEKERQCRERRRVYCREYMRVRRKLKRDIVL